jgi:tetratricopeptide (TPR) repeat protein
MNNLIVFIFVFILSVSAHSQIRYGKKGRDYDSNNMEAVKYYSKGYSAFQNNELDNAIKYYRLAYQNDTKFTDAIDNLAMCFRRVNKLDSAEYYYNVSLSIFPKNMLALNNLALVYILADMYDKSIETYNKILKIDSLNADGYYGLADVKLRQNDYDAVIKYASKAYALWIDNDKIYAGDAMRYIGLANLNKGNKKEAKSAFKKAESLGTEIPPEYYKACEE